VQAQGGASDSATRLPLRGGSDPKRCRASSERAVAEKSTHVPASERFNAGEKGTMVSAYHQFLKAALKTLTTLEGQLQFMITRTGFSDECLRRVLVHLNAQPVSGDEWDLEVQARDAGVSIEQHAVAMSPLLEMSVQQTTARLREIQARIARGEDPGLSDDEVEQVRKWSGIVRTIARLSGEAYAVVISILCAVGELTTRQHEILQELTRLKDSGENPSASAL